jgi:hypothetical protein
LTGRYAVRLTSTSMRRVWPLASALLILLLGAPSALATPKHAAAKHPGASGHTKPTEVKLKPAPGADAEAAAPSTGVAPTRGPTRIDFDDRLIQGQSNKSGAVYLYDRKELKTRSMVKKRESFRDEIVTSVFDT